jgi:hypothetical protein
MATGVDIDKHLFNSLHRLIALIEPGAGSNFERLLLAQSGRSSSLTEHKCDLQLMCNPLISLGIKTKSFTAKSLKRRHKRQTLNQLVFGFSV